MIRLNACAVHLTERLCLHRCQVDEPQVGITVPNVECSPFTHSHQQPSAIGRDARQRGTEAERVGREDHFTGSELARGGIESLTIDVVAYVFIAHDSLGFVAAGAVGILEMGRTIIKPATVGTPTGKGLKLSRVVFNRHHLVFLNVVEYQVALIVKHLDLVDVARMETLHGTVGTEGNELLLNGMPCGIDTGREGLVGLQVHLLQLTIVINHRSAQILTCVEQGALRIAQLTVMTVDALAVGFGRAQHVVVNDSLLIVFQTTLIQRQFLVGDVGWRNQAVANPRINRVGRHIDGKWLIVDPRITRTHVHIDNHGIAHCLGYQRLPVVGRGAHLLAAQHQFFIASRQSRHHLVGFGSPLKMERSHVHRHCHARIVRIDGHWLTCLLVGRWHLHLTAGSQQQKNTDI